MKISIVIPAKNEAQTIAQVINDIQALNLEDYEILVVNDGSSDLTGEIAASTNSRVINHPYSKGNGAAVKAGVRSAGGDIVVLMDGDGQHDPADIPKLLQRIDEGYDLVVGSRQGQADQASLARWIANWVYARLATWVVGHRVLDLTSGFRAVRRSLMSSILHMLPNGFSYPTTSTIAFFRAGHSVTFETINIRSRTQESKSHIRLVRDGTKFFLIIFRIATLYSPLKVFFPASLAMFTLGTWYYVYTFLITGRFTNFGAVLLISSVIIFLIGLVSEQITMLIYSADRREKAE